MPSSAPIVMNSDSGMNAVPITGSVTRPSTNSLRAIPATI